MLRTRDYKVALCIGFSIGANTLANSQVNFASLWNPAEENCLPCTIENKWYLFTAGRFSGFYFENITTCLISPLDSLSVQAFVSTQRCWAFVWSQTLFLKMYPSWDGLIKLVREREDISFFLWSKEPDIKFSQCHKWERKK